MSKEEERAAPVEPVAKKEKKKRAKQAIQVVAADTVPNDTKILTTKPQMESMLKYHFATIKSVNFVTMEVTFKFGFIDPSQLSQLELLRTMQDVARIFIEPKQKQVEPKTFKQHRMFFAMVRTIMFHKKKHDPMVVINPMSLRILYDELRKGYFPLRVFHIGTTEYYIAPSIRELSKEEMSQVIDAIIRDYSIVGVDFYEWKEKYRSLLT